MNGDCPHDRSELRTLREWAWDRGRTDVVLTLDLHERGWAYAEDGSRSNLLALAAVLPVRWDLGERLHRLAIGAAAADDVPPEELRAWCAGRCRDVEAALAETRIAASGA